MTYLEKFMQEHPDYKGREDYVIDVKCPFNNVPIRCLIPCHECWNQEIPEYEHKGEPIAKTVSVTEENGGVTVELQRIKDSGDRTEFATGAVRDMREGKGRCDLMPLDVVAAYVSPTDGDTEPFLWNMYMFLRTNQVSYLYSALHFFEGSNWNESWSMLLDVAKHFEDGAKKYGESNWQKGIPVYCYIDSAIRHYLKWCREDTDEPHDRAVVWNLLCCIWTIKHEAELKTAQ